LEIWRLIAGSFGVGTSFAIVVRMAEVNKQRDNDTGLNTEISSLKISAEIKRYSFMPIR